MDGFAPRGATSHGHQLMESFSVSPANGATPAQTSRKALSGRSARWAPGPAWRGREWWAQWKTGRRGEPGWSALWPPCSHTARPFPLLPHVVTQRDVGVILFRPYNPQNIKPSKSLCFVKCPDSETLLGPHRTEAS